MNHNFKKIFIFALIVLIISGCSENKKQANTNDKNNLKISTSNTTGNTIHSPKTDLKQNIKSSSFFGNYIRSEYTGVYYKNNIEIKYHHMAYDGTYDSNEIKQLTDVKYPEIIGLKNITIQNTINRLVRDYIDNYNSPRIDISTNVNNVLCINISYSDNNELTKLKTFLYDLNSGKPLSLKDIFADGADYEKILINAINQLLLKYNLDEILLIKPLTGIEPLFDFYITDGNILVLTYNTVKHPYFLSPKFVPFEVQKKYAVFENFYSSWDVNLSRNSDFIQFFIPFSMLEGSIDIYNKYFDSKNNNIVSYSNKQLFYNYLDLKNKSENKKSDTYDFTSSYVQINNFEIPSVKEKINTYILNEVKNGLNNITATYHGEIKDDFDKIDKSYTYQVHPYGNYFSVLRQGGVNGFNLKNNEKSKFYNEVECQCFDLRTGDKIILEDLFVKGYDYLSVIDKTIRKELSHRNKVDENKYKVMLDSKYKGIRAYLNQLSFLVLSDKLDIHLLIDDVDKPGSFRDFSFFVPYSVFEADKLKL